MLQAVLDVAVMGDGDIWMMLLLLVMFTMVLLMWPLVLIISALTLVSLDLEKSSHCDMIC